MVQTTGAVPADMVCEAVAPVCQFSQRLTCHCPERETNIEEHFGSQV
jgi:hypothetical protein